jgi:putative flippase GtrA
VKLSPQTVVERAQKDLGQKLFKYSAVSVVSVIVTQVTLIVCLEVVGWSAVWSNVAAVSVGSVPAYLLNRAWVWGKSGRSHLFKEVLPFWGMALAGLALSTWAVSVVEDVWPGSTLAISIANLGAFGALWLGKFVVLEEVLFKTHHAEDEHAESG